MELREQLRTKLDAGALLQAFLGDLGGPASSLQSIASPVSDDRLSGTASTSAGVDFGSLAPAVASVAARITPDLVPAGPADLIRPLTDKLALLEKLTTGDLGGDLRSLADRLTRELQGEGSPLDALLRVAGVVTGSPAIKALLELIGAITQAAGVNVTVGGGPLDRLLPAIQGGVQAAGGLMSLVSVLAESERLTTIMAAQLDAGSMAAEVGGLVTCFGGDDHPIEAMVAGLASASDAEVSAAILAVQACAARLDRVARALAEAMGFGEATLVHLGIGKVQATVAAGAAALRGVDLAAIDQVVKGLVSGIQPIADLHLEDAPAEGLDAILTLVEGKAGEVAASIAAVDLDPVAAPVRDGIGRITAVIDEVTKVLTTITVTVRTALEAVRSAIAALPLDTIANAIKQVLDPVRAAMDALRALVHEVGDAVKQAAEAATSALGTVEGVIDGFKQKIEALLGAAADFVHGLHLDQVVGSVGDQVKAFVDSLGKADMKPYFDGAVDAIGGAADVIGAVPFGLLPDSMKADVDAAVAPIKAVDAHAFEAEIEEILQIEDGKFQLRPQIEAAVAEVQALYEALIEEVEKADPRGLIAPLDAELAKLSAKIAEISPGLTLEPIRAAIESVKQQVTSFDLRAQLAPLEEPFARIIAALDEYSPGKLLAPIEARVTAARQKVIDTIRLAEWKPSIDSLVESSTALLDRLDPAELEPALGRAFAELRGQLGRLPSFALSGLFGNLVAALLAGAGLRVRPGALQEVLGWLGGGGAGALTARAGRIADAVTSTRAAVASLDLSSVAVTLKARADGLRAAALALPDGSRARLAIAPIAVGLHPDAVLAALDANRQRYLATLDEAAAAAETLRRTGLSEVDVTLGRLGEILSPARIATDLVRSILARLGITGFDAGIGEVLGKVLDVASPARLAGVVRPIFLAARGRVTALLDAVLTPIRGGIDKLQALIDAVDLRPIREELDAIFAQVKQEILALSPTGLLGAELDAFDALRAEIAAFDPIHDIVAALDAVRDTAKRIVDKLKAEALLAAPIRIYDDIHAALSALDVASLVSPVLDQLDAIAGQVDEGLDRTVDAFERLQAALPAGGGGSSASGSVSVG